jgi:hypothetical protein
VVKERYIDFDLVWKIGLRKPMKKIENIFVIWKVAELAFPLVGNWLVWKFGNGSG